MVTARGIYYNLDESIYFYRVSTYKFHFSSKQYRDKFIKLHKSFVENEFCKFKSRYKDLEIEEDDYFLFMLYNEIEKRGFLVTKDDLRITKFPSFTLKLIMEWWIMLIAGLIIGMFLGFCLCCILTSGEW